MINPVRLSIICIRQWDPSIEEIYNTIAALQLQTSVDETGYSFNPLFLNFMPGIIIDYITLDSCSGRANRVESNLPRFDI